MDATMVAAVEERRDFWIMLRAIAGEAPAPAAAGIDEAGMRRKVVGDLAGLLLNMLDGDGDAATATPGPAPEAAAGPATERAAGLCRRQGDHPGCRRWPLSGPRARRGEVHGPDHPPGPAA